jgi:amidase
MSEELVYKSASDLAAMVRTKRVSSRELLDAFTAQIARRNPAVNAVVQLDLDRARALASAADELTARGTVGLGALHGVPMTVKDSFMTEGVTTTSGAPELADFVPDVDAVPVGRLKSAGAIVFGKTNLPIYADDLQSYNEVYGTTNNPWDLERTPGGSSGGSAAALAAGMTPIELGSDIGGSIRIPSHFSGTAGHKPSFGIICARGQIPGPPGTLTEADVAVAGPMARTVEDLELGLDVLVCSRPGHDKAWRIDLPAARHRELREFRVAAWLDDPGCEVDAGMREVLESAVEAMRNAGVKVADDARPEGVPFVKAARTFEQLVQGAESAGRDREVFARLIDRANSTWPDDDDPRARTSRYITQRHADWLRVNERRLQMAARWERFFADYDVLLAPTVATTAIRHDHSREWFDRKVTINGKPRFYGELTHWCGVFGVVYLPATVIPVGQTSEGLPVGLQIVGPFLEDRTTLAFAREALALLGGFVRPPGY